MMRACRRFIPSPVTTVLPSTSNAVLVTGDFCEAAMGNLLTATVSINGIRPFLWHAFGPDTIPADGKKERTGVAGNDPVEWTRSVLVTKEKQLFIEPTYVFGCLRDGARFVRKGKGSLQPSLAATLQVVDDRILFDQFLPDPLLPDAEQPVYLDVRSVKNPTTKGRNVRYRVAAAPGWSFLFHILWDKTIVSRSEMEAICIDAGRLAGIGDGRAIGFGRFNILSFEVADA